MRQSIKFPNRVSGFAASLSLVALLTFSLIGVQSAAAQATQELPAAKERVEKLIKDAGVESSSETESEVSGGVYEADETALKRITHDIEYMASDEMGGRQPGTPGIQLCEDYIVAEYKKAGLKPLENGTYLQPMEVGNTREVNKEKTSLVLKGPEDKTVELKLGENFQQLLCRKDFDLSSDLVFVGYGISAEEHNYDDYANIDVEGKIVVLIRYEPQVNDASSVFDGEEATRHASGRTKVTAARRAGAAGILLVNDAASSDSGMNDVLVQSNRFRTNSLPIAQIKRSVIDQILEATPLVTATGDKLTSLALAEEKIDSNLEPISQTLEGWSAKFESKFVEKKTKTNNIIGIIEGEGPNADETIIIGAHYDHLGMGAYGSRAQGRREIHNGADDNATGTAAVIELARRFNEADKKPGRRLVFICFTAEEMGLLGAYHYVNDPTYPLDKIACMVNFDMIGWLRDDNLTLYGWNSSAQLGDVFDAANKDYQLNLKKPASGFAGSDHLPFDQRGVPNVFIHTGLTSTYHTPEDDFETIDCSGALKVIDYTEVFVQGLADLDKKPVFGKPKPFRLGVMINAENENVMVDSVSEGSAAERAGLQKGDIILAIGGTDIAQRRDLTRSIRRDAGKTVKFKLKRGDSEMTLNVALTDE